MNESEHTKIDAASELTEEQREHIRTIENLPIFPYSRAEILLAYRGQKPVTEFSLLLRKWPRNEIPPEVNEEQQRIVHTVIDSLNLIGLPIQCAKIWRTPEEYSGAEYFEKATYMTSKDPEALERAKDLWTNRSAKTRQEQRMVEVKLGRLFGYPDTATAPLGLPRVEREAAMYQHEELPEDIRNSEAERFHFFRFSRQHVREEFAVVQQWADEIRRLCPRLYQEIVGRGR